MVAIKQDEELSSPNVNYFVDGAQFSLLLKKASKFLAQRDRTSHEVRSFFISKGYDPLLSTQIANYMHQIGLLDDEKFLHNFVDSQIEKGYGRLLISEKLKKFGFQDSEISEKLNSIPKLIWIKSCEKQIQNSQKPFFKLFQYLLSRGFETEEIESAFQNLNIQISRDSHYESI